MKKKTRRVDRLGKIERRLKRLEFVLDILAADFIRESRAKSRLIKRNAELQDELHKKPRGLSIP